MYCIHPIAEDECLPCIAVVKCLNGCALSLLFLFIFFVPFQFVPFHFGQVNLIVLSQKQNKTKKLSSIIIYGRTVSGQPKIATKIHGGE